MAQEARAVLILGHGEMGQAMTFLLGDRHRLVAWQRPRADGTRAPADPTRSVALDEVAPRADVVLFCVPTAPHFELAARLRPLLARHAICVSVAKGLDDAGRTAAEALAAALAPEQPCAFLYGPMIAEEIRAGRPAFAALGAADADSRAAVRALFGTGTLALAPTADVAGISWAAVLKNPYAILFGVADGLALGDNVRGYLAAAALAELGAIVAERGGDAATPAGLAGLGDLVTTATSAGSRHHTIGLRLAHGDAHDLRSEGVNSLRMLRAHRLIDWARRPLLALVARMIEEPARAPALFTEHLRARASA